MMTANRSRSAGEGTGSVALDEAIGGRLDEDGIRGNGSGLIARAPRRIGESCARCWALSSCFRHKPSLQRAGTVGRRRGASGAGAELGPVACSHVSRWVSAQRAHEGWAATLTEFAA